ncbi:hypothetical protein BJX64DRAFT_212482 [Aspergillus heterothallicus]
MHTTREAHRAQTLIGMSLIARLQERAMDRSIYRDKKESKTAMAQSQVKRVIKHSSREPSSPRRISKTRSSRLSELTSTVLRTPDALAISLRGDDLRRLLYQLQTCQAPDATVHIFVHEDASAPRLEFEIQQQPSVSPGSSFRTSVSPPSSILDTLRVTTSERSFLEHMTTPESVVDSGVLSDEEDCGLRGDAPKAYMISADLSDAEWDEFTTL